VALRSEGSTDELPGFHFQVFSAPYMTPGMLVGLESPLKALARIEFRGTRGDESSYSFFKVFLAQDFFCCRGAANSQ
jgi:hypothetical protein